MLFFHPEMGDDGSGPVIILILLLYILAGAGLAGGAIYLAWKLLGRLTGRKSGKEPPRS